MEGLLPPAAIKEMLSRAFTHLLPICRRKFNEVGNEVNRLTNIEMETCFNAYREFGLYNAVRSIINLGFYADIKQNRSHKNP